ncbi:MAG: transposase, partial [Thermoleophilia bacterium]
DLRDGEGLPGFVEQEFHKFLQCGALGAGFARFRCVGCGFDRLVPFSCKSRALCPSCGGRRMTERAAHLVDHVFPQVPVRQWVLSLPYSLRYRLAWDHALCRAVVGCALRAILGFLRRRARDAGVRDGRGGAVTIVQRFGGALNMNIHFHALVMDGVFARDGDAVRFHPTPSLDAADTAEILATIKAYLRPVLARQGAGAGDDSAEPLGPGAEQAPVWAGLAAASVQGRVALGARAGARVRRQGQPAATATTPPGLGPYQARHRGFDLHAGVCVPADQRDRLERIARYTLRPPVAQDRLELTEHGQVRLALRRPWSDGTTHLLFEPIELLERLAALTPRPRVNLILYHGVLGARAAWRSLVVQYGTTDERRPTVDAATASEEPTASRDPRASGNYLWAELMRRSLALDVLACPSCGGRLRLIAVVDHPAVVARILGHLALPTEVPGTRSARAPPTEVADLFSTADPA